MSAFRKAIPLGNFEMLTPHSKMAAVTLDLRRRGILVLVAGLGGGASLAAEPKRRLGLLFLDRPEAWAFLEGELDPALGRLGWRLGIDLALERRYVNDQADRLPGLARETVRSGVDAIMTQGTLATRAAQRATTRIPIVTGVSDPVGLGFAESLARPGGNITGVSYAWPETAAKQIELLRQTLPNLSTVKILARLEREQDLSALERAARTFGIFTNIVVATSISEVRTALHRTPNDGRCAAVVLGLEGIMEIRAIAAAAIEARVPLMTGRQAGVEAGALMSYRLNWDHETDRRAAQIDKVLRGLPAASIPFELPPRSQFAINLRTARSIGITLPSAVLARADAVFE